VLGELDDQFEPMQAYHALADADWSRDKANPAAACSGGTDFRIDREASLVPNGISAKALHGRPRMLRIKRNRLVTANGRSSRQSENVVNAARPDEGIVRKIAFPKSGVMEPELANCCRLEDVRNGAVQDAAKVKMARLLIKRPAMTQDKRFVRGSYRQARPTPLSTGAPLIVSRGRDLQVRPEPAPSANPILPARHFGRVRHRLFQLSIGEAHH